ncbi:MAG: glycosyltransferase [Candidatus Bathyarchaeota archaeon]|nr:glycosyltransferase [Candidatus Bathyarchaeota archaeon]
MVSVVIPTFNSEQFLEICLCSIVKQTYFHVEIIVVDNYSADKTREIAQRYGNVVSYRGLRSTARNVGVNLAEGELILSIDSDMELTPNVIHECVDKAENGYDAVIIPEFSIGNGFWAKCRALEKECYFGDDLIEAARFFKKKTFETIGGYNSELVFGEDWDLNLKLKDAGCKIGRTTSFIKHHEGALSLRKVVQKKHYYGKTLSIYQKNHPEQARRQLKIIRPAFLKNWRKLYSDPVHTFGMLLMKGCEFEATWAGSLSTKIKSKRIK